MQSLGTGPRPQLARVATATIPPVETAQLCARVKIELVAVDVDPRGVARVVAAAGPSHRRDDRDRRLRRAVCTPQSERALVEGEIERRASPQRLVVIGVAPQHCAETTGAAQR